MPAPGAASEGLRVVSVRPGGGLLHLVVEGRAGRTYRLGLRTAGKVGPGPGVTVAPDGTHLMITFEGAGDGYVRRTIGLPLR
jgi:hypothetical protein